MTDLLTVQAACELIDKESIVLEWYLDNATPPVGTWGVGVTAASGENVLQYKDNPSTLEHALEVFAKVARAKYAPAVFRAFKGYNLSIAQFAAALSFEYNTGKIESTDWVSLVCEGQPIGAESFLKSHYLNGGTLQGRRNDEAALFFHGIWKSDGHANILKVSKPSYHPTFNGSARVDIRAAMAQALAA